MKTLLRELTSAGVAIGITATGIIFSPAVNAAVVNCQANRPDASNVLYLYYPTANDGNFPEFGTTSINTSPLAPFDVTNLDPNIGTTSQLRSAITERVRVDYCEFNVRTLETTSSNGTTNPTPSDPSWQVVGIGSDDAGTLFGIAEAVDIGNNNTADFGRVWAGTFDALYGGEGGALNGVNSTIERWSNAIAGTVSHEAGHNYGLRHGDSAPRPSEDPQNNHLLATGSTGLTGQDRTQDRHFSDTSFEILGANIGLFEQTLSNWDFVNPNNVTADGFQITVLVLPSDGTPSKASVYTGGLSPWSDVNISADGSESFNGITYNRFKIDFISPQSWNNGPDGEIPAGEEFHVGVGLTTEYLVRDTLLTSGGAPLQLNPRVVNYTTGGSFDPDTGDFHVTFSNPEPEEGELILSDFLIRYIPRTVDINEMISGGTLLGIDGLSIDPWGVRQTDQDIFQVVDTIDVIMGNSAEGRAVNFLVEAPPECERGIILPPPVPDSAIGEVEYCSEGQFLGLFPSTRIYFEATVTDPDAQYFDPDLQMFVNGPLQSQIFVQLSGVKPDINDNDIDDAIDIANGECEDTNQNGLCDEAATTPEPSTILSLLTIGGIALASSKKKRNGGNDLTG
ncbi:MAG: M66 family metalloprotease [Crocosphaera sp.]|nr:M66 family metalloprotease [Crocosphaera sp.]